MQRYFLSSVTGTGTKANPFRATGFTGTNHAALFRSGPTTAGAICLALAGAVDLTTQLNNTALTALPDFPLTTLLSTIPKPVMNAINNKLVTLGLTKPVLGANATFGDWLRSIGRQLEPAFDETILNVM